MSPVWPRRCVVGAGIPPGNIKIPWTSRGALLVVDNRTGRMYKTNNISHRPDADWGGRSVHLRVSHPVSGLRGRASASGARILSCRGAPMGRLGRILQRPPAGMAEDQPRRAFGAPGIESHPAACVSGLAALPVGFDTILSHLAEHLQCIPPGGRGRPPFARAVLVHADRQSRSVQRGADGPVWGGAGRPVQRDPVPVRPRAGAVVGRGVGIRQRLPGDARARTSPSSSP